MTISDRHSRLRDARIRAGFERQRDAIERFGWNRNSYKSHENGNAVFSFDQAKTYAKAFGVQPEWLYSGTGAMTASDVTARVPLVGYVGAGAEAHFYGAGDGDLDYVDAPPDSTSKTVAAEIRGTSLGPLFDRWLIYYDDVRTPVTPDLYHRLCICGLTDDRVLVKQLKPAGQPNHFHLLSNNEPPIFDQEVLWAARVRGMTPR